MGISTASRLDRSSSISAMSDCGVAATSCDCARSAYAEAVAHLTQFKVTQGQK